MTEEIINTDGSRNWEANILLDNVKRLEQENKELKEKVKELDKMTGIFSARLCDKYRSALEEIRTYINTLSSIDSDFTNTETYLRIQTEINEVLQCEGCRYY